MAQTRFSVHVQIGIFLTDIAKNTP